MRVPFIAAWAKADGDNPHQNRLPIAVGAIQSQLAAVHDLFPTILGLAGISAPESHVVDGVRLDTLLAGRADDERPQSFLMHYPHSPHRSDYFTCFRDGDWKVIYHYFPSKASGNSSYQLFNLAEDIGEQHNIAAASSEVAADLKAQLDDWLAETGAKLPVRIDHPESKSPRAP